MTKAKPLKLVTGRQAVAGEIKASLSKLAKEAKAEEYVAMATILVRKDGESFFTIHTNGNRTLLLGAVTDLQYEIANVD